MKKSGKILKILLVGAVILNIECIGLVNYEVFATENILDNNTTDENVANTNTNTSTDTNTSTNDNTTSNTNTAPVTPVVPVTPVKKAVSSLKVSMNSNVYSYTGGQRNPIVTVYDGSKKLKVNKDYRLTYKNNINPGIASFTIAGIGNYKGTVTKNYYIAPAKEKIYKVTFNSTATKATITWREDTKATGYKIYMSNSKNGTYTRIRTFANNKVTEYTKGGLDPAKEYYFKVRAYKQYGNIQIMKKYSEPKTSGKLIASVTLTAHGSGANRKYNLKRASEKISGLVIKPGKEFNWFKVVGPASKSRGYKLASVFKAGKVAEGYGGGVCQVSSTVYQASKKAKLQIVERHIHSRPVTYTRLGNDATVSYGVQNLRIRNNKNYSIRLVNSASGESTTCKIYSIVD